MKTSGLYKIKGMLEIIPFRVLFAGLIYQPTIAMNKLTCTLNTSTTPLFSEGR